MQIKFRHGLNEVNTQVDENTTISEVIDDGAVVDALRLPEQYSVLVNGVAASTNTALRNGDVVVFERAAAAKAV